MRSVPVVQISFSVSQRLEILPSIAVASKSSVCDYVVVFDEDVLLVDDFGDVLALPVGPAVYRDVRPNFDRLVRFVIMSFFDSVVDRAVPFSSHDLQSSLIAIILYRASACLRTTFFAVALLFIASPRESLSP